MSDRGKRNIPPIGLDASIRICPDWGMDVALDLRVHEGSCRMSQRAMALVITLDTNGVSKNGGDG